MITGVTDIYDDWIAQRFFFLPCTVWKYLTPHALFITIPFCCYSCVSIDLFFFLVAGIIWWLALKLHIKPIHSKWKLYKCLLKLIFKLYWSISALLNFVDTDIFKTMCRCWKWDLVNYYFIVDNRQKNITLSHTHNFKDNIMASTCGNKCSSIFWIIELL